ncbi:MAG: IS30 family transposase, partial [Candidatus Saccharimonadales bacterium]
MKHLTAADRGRIETLLTLQHSNTQIARLLGRHKSTITREIQKGTNHVGRYTAEYAELVGAKRQRRSYNTPKLTKHSNLGDYVIDHIKAGWDPSQIAGRLKATGANPRICSETIYAWVYDSSANQQEKLYQYLRYGKKRRGRQRTAERTRQQFKIPNRVSIHDRPTVVDERSRLGDWEGDLVMFPKKQSIATLYERTTSYVLFARTPGKQSEPVCKTIGRLLARHTSHTLTLDNGPEFYRHRHITELSSTSVYFADPYASRQRGGNENLNRQLRAYLPKGHDIASLTDTELIAIQDELNNKPRKRLGWHSPAEIYEWFANHPEQT